MSIKRGRWAFVVLVTAVIWGLSEGGRLIGKTIEIEDEDAIVATPTPVAKSVPKAPKKAEKQVEPTKVEKSPAAAETRKEVKVSPAPKAVATGPRVRMDEKIGFYYFLRAGYVVQDVADVVSLGQVERLGSDPSYSFGKTCRLNLTSAGDSVKVGDQLIVYRTKGFFQESQSGFSGYWTRTVAVLKVLEVGEQGTLAKVLKSFDPIFVGDQIKAYDGELDRWKEAQVKKNLPSEAVHCFVAGGDFIHDQFSQPEFIVLTAGADQGVVEGQDFQLREKKKTSDEEEVLGRPAGVARVFFAGSGFSMAQILTNSQVIYKGFEARYEP